MKPMMRPTAAHMSGYSPSHLSACDIHAPIMPPIFTARCLLAGLLQVANGCFIRLSSVVGPRAPCGMEETGTGILVAML